MSNYEENDFCPFIEISLKEYEVALNEIYRVEIQNEKIHDDNFYTECAQKIASSVMRKFWNNKQYEVSEEEVCKEIDKLLFGKMLNDMEKSGQVESTIDKDGEVYYKLTEEGKKFADNIVNTAFDNNKEK